MSKIHYKSAFEDLSFFEVDEWISECENLVGSCIFSRNNNIISKIISFFEKFKCKDKKFIPSHVGSIVKEGEEFYIFDMKPPFAKKTLLLDYLMFSSDDYVLVLRDFTIDPKRFSNEILKHEGELYPFLSAIRSIGTKKPSKKAHCSELHLKTLQKQGLFLNVNPEITPDELWHLLNENKTNK